MIRWLIPLLACAPTAALADIVVNFDEGAPKDRFIIENTSACPLPETELVIDLAGSAGKLIFDVTGTGAGVQVFQPFELVEGAEALRRVPDVGDGDRSVALDMVDLAPGGRIVFTIDVDDTIGAREITVAGSEIAGAVIRSGAGEGTFGTDARASLAGDACMS